MKKTYILLLSFMLLLLVEDVNAQLKLGDQPTSVQKSVILDLQGSNGRQGVWLSRISDTTDVTGIDALNPPDGVMMYHTPSAQVMIRRNGFWSSLQTTTKVGSTTSSHSVIEFQLGTAAGVSKDLNMTLSNTTGVITLNIPDAAVDTRGVVTTGSQAFGGVKTFSNGLTSLSTTTVSGASSNASNLYLGITSATTPGSTTDRFLAVDNSGRVVLSQGIPSTRSITINGTTYDLSANRTWNVGTVTSIAGGYGLSGGTITSSGTFAVDSFLLATRSWRQKGLDSIAAIIGVSYVPLTRTLNGLALSANQTFATGTSGTDFNISSSGTTHTFNIPDASATNRGAVTNGAQTFAGLKTFSNGVNVPGATSNASNLTLGITSATTPGSVTDRYLTVDATGKVILSNMSVVNSLAAIGNTPNANGGTLAAGVLTFQPASATFGGVVTTGTQSFAGAKTFATSATVSGATSNASNLSLGVNSATTPGTATDRYLTVNGSGTVTVNYVSVTAATGLTKIKNYTVTMDNLPNNISALSSDIVTFTIAGANFSTTSTVHVSPTQALQSSTSIGWARVLNATTIQMGVTAFWSQQNFTPGNSSTFNITVIEF